MINSAINIDPKFKEKLSLEGQSDGLCHVGVLDIFGFENFPVCDPNQSSCSNQGGFTLTSKIRSNSCASTTPTSGCTSSSTTSSSGSSSASTRPRGSTGRTLSLTTTSPRWIS